MIVRDNYHTKIDSISPVKSKIRSMKFLWLFHDMGTLGRLCKESWYKPY